jgi:hypothetical protein
VTLQESRQLKDAPKPATETFLQIFQAQMECDTEKTHTQKKNNSTAVNQMYTEASMLFFLPFLSFVPFFFCIPKPFHSLLTPY